MHRSNNIHGDIMKRIFKLGLCLLLFLAWTVLIFPKMTLAVENNIKSSALQSGSAPDILDAEGAEELGISSDYVGYFAIDSAEDLLWFMENASGSDIRAFLISDIVLNDGLLEKKIAVDPYTGEPSVKDGIEVTEWTPVERFSGILDGGGHGIIGLYIKSNLDNTGLISTLSEGGAVRNLEIRESYIYSTGDFTGSAVGHNLGEISSVYNYSDVASTGKYTGGIAGKNDGTVSASANCHSLQGGDFVGGIAGQNNGKITHSLSAYEKGEIYICGARYIGGIAGENFGEIGYCYSASSLIGETEASPIAAALGYGSDLYSNYYLGDTESDSASGTEYKTKEAFLSGEVAYLLNLGGETFYQTVGAEMPSFIGARVYKNHTLICPGDEGGEPFYSNTDGDIILNPDHVASGECDEKCNHCGSVLNPVILHTFVDNCGGFCEICGEIRIPPHSYNSACDTDCNDCGETRETEHKYENACDETCDICSEIRQVSPHIFAHPCSRECSICGSENPDVIHTYTDDCDTVCEFCESTRTVFHFYDNNCDEICNLCQHEREAEAHLYHNACDSICDECGFERVTPSHQYANGCDITCNECGFEREAGEHVYDHSCDPVCNECGAQREGLTHTYDNPCDPDCDYCGKTRDDLTHTYDNSCDATCHRCGYTRTEIIHTYNSPCDGDCNTCGAIRTDIEHAYDNACDEDCNICGFIRLPDEHIFGEYRVSKEPTRTEEGQECRRCTVCGEEEIKAIPRLEMTRGDKLLFIGVASLLMIFITVVAIIIRKRMQGQALSIFAEKPLI